MKLAIRYKASYQYGESASFSPHWARLFPRADHGLAITHHSFATHPTADVQYRRDLFDNVVARCFFPEPLDRLDFSLDLDLVVPEKNPFHFLLDSHAIEVPFAYTEAEAYALSPFLDGAALDLPAALAPSAPQPTVEKLTALNMWLHGNIAYERREEGAPFEPRKTLELAKGSCRDFAVLFAAVLRMHGLAARLVSGYLWERADPSKPRTAENALHAWVEAYLPGAGWTGFDPTNGVLCDHHFIAAAVGLASADISPVDGFYYGKKTIKSVMDSTLQITETKN